MISGVSRSYSDALQEQLQVKAIPKSESLLGMVHNISDV